MPVFRTAYGDRERVTLDCEEDVLTEQHHQEALSIRHILQKFDRTGVLEPINGRQPMYGDFTEANEYQDSLNQVIRAQEAFSALPAAVRKRFDNDPGAFFEFATNPENLDEMRELGLADKLAEPSVQKVEIVNQEPPNDSSLDGV